MRISFGFAERALCGACTAALIFRNILAFASSLGDMAS